MKVKSAMASSDILDEFRKLSSTKTEKENLGQLIYAYGLSFSFFKIRHNFILLTLKQSVCQKYFQLVKERKQENSFTY